MDRFWKKVQKGSETECWNWIAYRDKDGYGQFSLNGKQRKAHRVVYEFYNGPIQKNMCVCHKCDNPGCVNPNHLFLGTDRDNMMDKKNKNRAIRGIKHYKAKLTEQAILEIRDLHKKGIHNQKQLAAIFKVSESTISTIINRRKWKHI